MSDNMFRTPALIRSRRTAAGLTQRALAKRAGTSAATINRYEKGTVDPTTDTLFRILAAATKRRRRWVSLQLLAPELAGRDQSEPDRLWRLVGEFLDDTSGADDEELVRSVADPPLPTGSRRVDSLCAALAEHLTSDRGLPAPVWAQAPIECVPWWFVAGTRFAAMSLQESPPSFAKRGIFITAGALERV